MRILIVDDNRDIIELLHHVLAAEGHEVVVARDGLDALQQEASARPGVVVCDVNLPGIDGWEVCRRIKARRDIPVLLLTVRAERADIERSRAAGADDHMLKPFDIGEFLERLARLTSRARSPAASDMP
jgi:DNA-binding response OmpR family regulator